MASIVPVLTIALSASIAACEPDAITELRPEVEAVDGEDLQARATQGDRERFKSLAVVVAPGGAEVEFGRLETGGITVSELIRTGEKSPMNALVVAQKATPLEMFMAIAPGRTVPAELVTAHAAYAAAKQRDPAPRRLSLVPPTAKLPCGLDPRCSEEYHNLAADCSLAADRHWFDLYVYLFEGGGFLGEPSNPGSSWNEYGRTDSYSGESSLSPKVVSVMSHLCNDGPAGTKVHRMVRSDCGTTSAWSYMINNEVQPGYRRSYLLFNDAVACHYRASNTHKIGSSHYPTYSYGIITPRE